MRHTHWSSYAAWFTTLAALVLLAPTAAATGGQEKVEICHVPPGNPDNPQPGGTGLVYIDEIRVGKASANDN